jgi:diguanylate cyclase (GGDEF)-like protein
MAMLDRIAIRYKLIILLGLSGGFALLISSLIMMSSMYLKQSKSSMQVLHQLTDVISENMQAALAFDDASSAGKILSSLHANPHILLANVTTSSGQTLSEYRADSLPPERAVLHKQALEQVLKEHELHSPDQFFQRIQPDWMGVVKPVFFEGQPIGTLSLLSDTQMMWDEFRKFVLMQALASLLTVALLLFLALKFQAVFTRPILNLIGSMRAVAQTKNYRTVLKSDRQDEFKHLYDVFNSMLVDIQERDERLFKLATTDALTGLANRHHAMELMNTIVARAQRTNRPFGLIVVDLDFFKNINDTYGHQTGDLVLREAAKVLRSSARDYDLVARMGGEEFLIVCDDAPLQSCIVIAERIQQSLASLNIEYAPNCRLNVTASLGVYSSTQHPEDTLVETMLSAADAALYQAKHAGRNTYCVA